MNADVARYARITHRLALGAASADDKASQALAAALERRVVESIASECAAHVTSDQLSERLAQAVVALGEHGVSLRVSGSGVVVEGCFCEREDCRHAATLLGRLLGVAIESIIAHEGHRALHPVGAIDAAGYTARASMNASRLRS